MLRINPAIKTNNNIQNKTTFKSQVVTLPNAEQTDITNVTPTYNVKVPIQYQKNGVINLPYGFQAHSYKLANGQRVMIVPKKGETVVRTYVGTGSLNEPDRVRGISHYIEHNLFNGSEGLDAGEFFATVDNMGAETNASTGFAETNYYISSNLLNEGDLEKKIKIHASMLETPKFALDMLEKEKGIVNSEINIYQGDAETITANATLKKLYNIKSTSGDLIAGTTHNINNLTREDVVDYYNNNYYPANMVTVITGEVNPDEAINLIAKYFSGTNKTTHPRKFEQLNPIQKTVRQDLSSDKTNSTLVMLGFAGPQNNDTKNLICMRIIREMLTNYQTGTLANSLKKLNSFPGMNFEKISSRPQDPSAIFIQTETTEENCEKVLQEIFNQIHKIATENPATLDSIKKGLLLDNSIMFESSFGINNTIGSCMLDGNMDYATNYENIVNSITPQDIQNTAKQFLNLNKTAVTVLHPEKQNKQVSFTGNIQKQAINPLDVKRFKLANNFDVATSNSVSNVGNLYISFDCPEIKSKPAAGIILNELLKEGSMFRSDREINNDLSKDSIYLNFTSGNDGIEVSGTFAPQDMAKAINIAKEVMQNPRLTQEDLDRVKNRISDIYSRMEKSASTKLMKELMSNNSSGYTREEILESLKDTTLEDISNLYRSIIQTSQGHASISAPFNYNPYLYQTALNSIGGFYGVKPSMPYIEKTFEPSKETKVLTDTHAKSQAQILEAYKFKHSNNLKDITAINIMNHILGGSSSSRLFNDLREKQQLAYSVNSRSRIIGDTGIITLSIGTTTENPNSGETNFDNVQKSINGFNKHINKMMNEKVTEEELAHAKLSLKNEILSKCESSKGTASEVFMGLSDFYGPLMANDILKMIDQITVDDIYNAANYIFRNNKPTYSILATENTLKANEEFFKAIEN